MQRPKGRTAETDEQLSSPHTGTWQQELEQILERTEVDIHPQRLEDQTQEELQAPARADSDEISRTMRTFEAALGDVLATIAVRARSRLMAYVQQEIPRALEEAMGPDADFADRFARRVNGEYPQPLEKQRHQAAEDGSQRIPKWMVGGSKWMGAPPPAPVSHQTDNATVTEEAAEEEDQGRTRWGVTGIAEEPVPALVDGVYEGNVRLRVDGNANIYLVIRFLQTLRREVRLRVHGMVSNAKKDVEVLIGLREPLYLKEILAEMREVSQVRVSGLPPPEGVDPLLHVKLHNGLARS